MEINGHTMVNRFLAAPTFVLLASLTACVPAATAQQPHLSPAEVGQIADEVMSALIAPDDSLSGVPVSERGIVFDFDRTMAAFAEAGTPEASLADLHMQTPVELGTRELLADCTPFGQRKDGCTRLGRRVYVHMRPVSVTDSEVVVQASCFWPDRGEAARQHGLAVSSERASLVGFSSEVHLVRTPAGKWEFSRVGTTLVS